MKKELEYKNPYHHYVHSNGICHHSLGFGLEYLNYLETVLDWLAELHPQSVLDFGCGDGKLTLEMSSDIAQVTGIDLNSRATTFAKLYNPASVEIVNDDVSNYAKEWENRFDVVTAVEVLEHISTTDLDQLETVFKGILTTKGHLLVCVPTTLRPTQEQHYRHYDLTTLTNQLSRFELVRYVYCHKLCVLETMLRRILSNRWWHLRESLVQQKIFSLYKRTTRKASEKTGAHLIALFRNT